MNKLSNLQDVIEFLEAKDIDPSKVVIKPNKKSFSVSLSSLGVKIDEDHPGQTFLQLETQES